MLQNFSALCHLLFECNILMNVTPNPTRSGPLETRNLELSRYINFEENGTWKGLQKATWRSDIKKPSPINLLHFILMSFKFLHFKFQLFTFMSFIFLLFTLLSFKFQHFTHFAIYFSALYFYSFTFLINNVAIN